MQQQLELALLQPPFYEEVIPLLASMQRDCQVGFLKSHDCHMTCREIGRVCFSSLCVEYVCMCTLNMFHV